MDFKKILEQFDAAEKTTTKRTLTEAAFEKSGVKADAKKNKADITSRKQYFVKLANAKGGNKGVTVMADEGESESEVRSRVARDHKSQGWTVSSIREKGDAAEKAAAGEKKSAVTASGKKRGRPPGSAKKVTEGRQTVSEYIAEARMMEKHMTDVQKGERERIVKGMKKAEGDFENRYPGRGKAVMYATATKRAMKEDSGESDRGYYKLLAAKAKRDPSSLTAREKEKLAAYLRIKQMMGEPALAEDDSMMGMTLDQAKQHPSYKSDPAFKADVDAAEKFSSSLSSDKKPTVMTTDQAKKNPAYAKDPAFKSRVDKTKPTTGMVVSSTGQQAVAEDDSMMGMTLDQAKQHPSYKTDPAFKADVDAAEKFSSSLSSTEKPTVMTTDQAKKNPAYAKDPAFKSRVDKTKPTTGMVVSSTGQQAMAEGGEKDRQWSNKDMERLRVAIRDFDDIMASDGPDQTKHNLIKKRIQTKPMAGPKGVLPEQGVAEGAECNSTMEGKECPVHGLDECSTYMEESQFDEDLSQMKKIAGIGAVAAAGLGAHISGENAEIRTKEVERLEKKVASEPDSVKRGQLEKMINDIKAGKPLSKGDIISEVNPHRYDSDVDYYDAEEAEQARLRGDHDEAEEAHIADREDQRRYDHQAAWDNMYEDVEDDAEYTDEVGMVENNLETIERAAEELDSILQDGEDLPEWIEEKVSNAKAMLVAAKEYMASQHANGDVRRVDDDEMDEGTEFTGALAKARAAHKDSFEVDGKTYPVKESRSAIDELAECYNMAYQKAQAEPEQQGRMTVSANTSTEGTRSLTVNAEGDMADELAQLLSLSGLASGHRYQEEMDESAQDEFHANTRPVPTTFSLSSQLNTGNDLNSPKVQHPEAAARGDNPLTR
jgi:hypothetical protein